MVKVCFPPCVVIDPQELGGALPNGALRGEENWESGFSALVLVLPKHDSWGPTIWERLRAFQCPARTQSDPHALLCSFFFLAGKQPPS